MANKSEAFNEGLTRAAIVLAAVAIVFWVVPCDLEAFSADEYDSQYYRYQFFTGLHNYADAEFLGRMPAFIVAAFSSIFLLQLRRR
jgi:hypothetical protein